MQDSSATALTCAEVWENMADACEIKNILYWKICVPRMIPGNAGNVTHSSSIIWPDVCWEMDLNHLQLKNLQFMDEILRCAGSL
jgi:hypothetical protein